MPEKNEIDWKEYEAITKYIYESLGAQFGVKAIGHGRNFKVTGKSGVKHQVDVLTEQLQGETRLLTAIECKYWNKKVTKETVMKLFETMQDADITSGIIVCKKGYTKDTVTYADFRGIRLVELREADENDADYKKIVDLVTININMNITISRPNITSIDLGSKLIVDQREIMSMYHAKVQNEQGRAMPFSEYLRAFNDELKDADEELKMTAIKFPFSVVLFLQQPEKNIPIEKIIITGFLTKIKEQSAKSFQLQDQVWLIMKQLFDQKNLTMSRSGLIWHLK